MSAALNPVSVASAQPLAARAAWRRALPWLAPALVLLLLLATPWLPAYHLSLLNRIGLAALATLGLVLLTGVAGMTSFGQAAFIGLGAYAGAWLTVGANVPEWLAPLAGSPWLALPVALVATTVVAGSLGALTLRLSGHYLPLGTLCWALALFSLFGTLESLGAHTGLSNLPAPELGPWTLDQPAEMAWLIWGSLLGAGALSWQLLDSRNGRALRALNGGQAMAESMGVPVFRMKLAVFVLSAWVAAVSGWLYAFEQRFVSPAPFSLGAGIDLLFMALIGGVGHLWGALAGAGVVTLARDWLQDWLPHLLGKTGNYEAIIFGALVIVLMIKAPQGLWGGLDRWARGRWPRSAAHTQLPPAQPLPRRTLPERGRRVLEVRGLTRRFGGLVANRDIDLDLHAGEVLAVIGPNGAGKSTLFNQLSCVDHPSSGTVRFFDQDVAGWAPRRMAVEGLSRTFQHVKLLPAMSALDNVAIGAHLRGRAGLWRSALHLERVEEASLLAEARHQLERVGLGHLAEQPAGSLALGQQRLLEIARALCSDPAVLLLDEPAAGLRLQEKQALAELLGRLREEGMAVLLVEHDMDFVMGLADRVACIVFGEKVADGLPAEVQAHPQVLQAYLGTDL